MIATDTSTLVAFLQDATGKDVDLLEAAARGGDLVLPPVVLTEVLSDESSSEALAAILPLVALLPVTDGFWERAGRSRRVLKRHGLKAKVADALIAQSCIDHHVPLIARDKDFRHFAKYCGLKLA